MFDLDALNPDTALDPEALDALLAAMSLEEKASLLSGRDDWFTQNIDRLGLPSIEVGDGPHGLRKETGVDMVWVPATGFPTGSAMGSSWDRDIMRRVAAAIAAEAKVEGVQLVLGPGVNMLRTPVCGRNFEYFAEDPLLAGEMGAAYVTGMQGEGVGTSLKHFAANNQEVERTRISVEADERTLRETYLAAFERVVRAADPWTVMCSYNRLAGVHASENSWLLNTVLRLEWGYRGAVVSDWNAVHHRVAALRAGLDLEMPGTGGRTDAEVVAAVRTGELDEGMVDTAARRVLELVARAYPRTGTRTGAFMDLGTAPGVPLTTEQLNLLQAEAHHALAREAAASCLTLLRNELHDGAPTLPLPARTNAPGSIAVIGAFAERFRTQGGGSSGVDCTRLDAPLDRIRDLAPGPVAYAPGYVHTPKNAYIDDLPAYLAAHGADPTGGVADPSRRSNELAESIRLAAIANRLVAGPISDTATRLIDEAAAAAEQAETIIAFVGLPLFVEQEAADRTTLALPTDHVALLQRLAEVKARTGARLVVVLSAGSAVTMDGWHDDADAILLAHLPGQAGGSAVADALFGVVNPSGKLAETFPLALEDTPAWVNYSGERGTVMYGEGVFVGYRWYDALRRAVRYPFGHGLSYTSFAYSDLRVEVTDAAAGTVSVQVTVTNVGDRAGREVVQLYVGDPEAAVRRPVRELRGFAKTAELAPGASEEVVYELVNRDFTYWDTAGACWRREGGQFVIEVAASSRDIRLAACLELPDDATIAPLIPDEELIEVGVSRFTAGHQAFGHPG